MTITLVPLGTLIEASYNPREITSKEFKALCTSIRQFGFVEPIVANKDHTIIGGHQRYRAAKALNMQEVPVTYVDLTKAQEQALNLALNKISGDWDDQKLAELIFEIKDLPELDFTGFSEEEVHKLLSQFSPVGGEETPRLDEQHQTTCPACGHTFTA